ncbi:MAG: macro domain-containing protein [Anaerolineales bacterium]|jgi:uncharacterized protein YwgA/O-acetyl-ADP-ribose deacetylase (regulator of RNase III)
MSVKVLVGDIFESDVQTLVNTVNCVGVMGKGIALGFKERYPQMYKDYVGKCDRGEVKLGYPYLYKSVVPPWIINFPTKDHWRSLAKVDDIIKGLEYLLDYYKDWGITSLAVPPLGAGLGQLEWRIIGPILYEYLNKMDIPVELFAPYDTPTNELELSFLSSKKQLTLRAPSSEWVSPGWVALVEIVNQVQKQPYHWSIGRTSFQKMVYVSQTEGLPLGIEFQRGSYGPFSPELKKKMSHLINNGLIREEREGRMFKIQLGPTYETAYQSYLTDLNQWDEIIKKVSDLFMRVNTKQSEIIATVIYVTEELQEKMTDKPSEMDVFKEVINWKQRREISKKEFASTIRNLAALGWLDVKGSKELPVKETL